jgi:acetolactate synthase-1/2/3 large subunit
MMGMHGAAAANLAIQEADLLIALGMRFDDRVTGRLDAFAPMARKIHVDLDESEIGKVVPVDVAIVADVCRVLDALLVRADPVLRPEWRERIDVWRSESKERDLLSQPNEGTLSIPLVIDEIHRQTNGEAIVVTDVGQHQMWSAQYFRSDGMRPFLTSGGLGTMGFGLPAAIGAQMAAPDAEVWCLAGDGGFQMNLQELATVVQEGLPLRIVVLNNGYLGMVRQWQEFFYGGRYESTRLSSPDFIRLAEAYGIQGWKATSPDEGREAVRAARRVRGPTLIEFQTVMEGDAANVYPMVPAGAALHEMIRRPSPLAVGQRRSDG